MGNPVVHFEIGCTNRAKTQKFFAGLFNWQMEAQGSTAMIDTGAEGGIDGHITSLGHEPHNYVTFYVVVEALAPYIEKAEKLGGKVLIPPTDIPEDEGAFAWIGDPDGNIIGLWAPGTSEE